MDGKVDWMAYGFPVEGDDGPFIGEQVSPVPTCDVQGTVADAREALEGSGQDQVIVTAGGGLAVGGVDAGALDGHGDDASLLDVMSPVPSTYRPSVTVQSLAEDGGGRFLVTTSDGRLLGMTTVEPAGHDHDHGNGGMEKELDDVLAAIDERFGGRSPSEEELRSFLRDRLIEEGRRPEDADRFLHELE